MVPLNGFRTAKCARKPFWKIDILSKAAGLITFPQLLLAHFAIANQARGFSINGTLGADGLLKFYKLHRTPS